MDSQSTRDPRDSVESVDAGKINSWKRGFTPQAEIWNGRMAMFSLIIGLFSLVIANHLLGN